MEIYKLFFISLFAVQGAVVGGSSIIHLRRACALVHNRVKIETTTRVVVGVSSVKSIGAI